MMNIDLFAVYDKSNALTAGEIEDEFIIVPIGPQQNGDSSEMYILNETGREIWERIDGTITVSQLIETMSARYNSVPAEQIKADIFELVNDLSIRKLIIEVEEI